MLGKCRNIQNVYKRQLAANGGQKGDSLCLIGQMTLECAFVEDNKLTVDLQVINSAGDQVFAHFWKLACDKRHQKNSRKNVVCLEQPK